MNKKNSRENNSQFQNNLEKRKQIGEQNPF